MPILISIPDDCKPLADAVTQLVTNVERAHRRAEGGRAVDYAHIERDIGERTAAVERAAHQTILAALDIDAPAVVIDGRERALPSTPHLVRILEPTAAYVIEVFSDQVGGRPASHLVRLITTILGQMVLVPSCVPKRTVSGATQRKGRKDRVPQASGRRHGGRKLGVCGTTAPIIPK